jgi:hypothetical protein
MSHDPFTSGNTIWPDAADAGTLGGSLAHGDHGDWLLAHHDPPLDPSGLASGAPHAADTDQLAGKLAAHGDAHDKVHLATAYDPVPGALIQPDVGEAAAGGTGPLGVNFPIDSSGLTGGHLAADHGSAASKVPVGTAAPSDLDGEGKLPADHGFADLKVPAGALDGIVRPSWGTGPKLHVVDSGEGNRHSGADGHAISDASDMSDEGKKGDERFHPFTVREDDSRKDDRSVQKAPALPPTLQDRRGLDSPQHPEVIRQPWDLHIVNDPLFDRLPRADEVVRSEEVGPYWRVELTRYGQLYLEETTIDGDRTGRFIHLSAKDWGQWGVGFDQDEQDIDTVTVERIIGQRIDGSYETSYQRTFKSDPSANLEP